MIELPAPAPRDPSTSDWPASASAAGVELVVGTRDLASKEQLVLRSLLRILDGRDGRSVRFSETGEDCNVVFVPADWRLRLPSSCITVFVVPEDDQALTADAGGLSVSLPLRMGSVMDVLATAADLLSAQAPAGDRGGLAALFLALTRLMMARERRTTTLPFVDGRSVIVDFASQAMLSEVPLEDLLAGGYRLGAVRRTEPEELVSLPPRLPLRMRGFVWEAAFRLGEQGGPCDPLSGRYRLQSWPDSVALSYPGYPRLATLLDGQPLSFRQICKASGATPATVRWFLEAGLAIGVAVPAQEAAPSDFADPAPNGDARSLVGRLRGRLKLG